MADPTAGITPAFPQRSRGLTASRRRAGLLLVAVGLPLLTGLLVTGRGSLSLASVLLLYLLAVVVAAVVGGLIAALAAAVTSFLLANFFLTPPYHTFDVEGRDSVVALVVFLAVATTVSAVVDLAARRQAAAVRSRAEADVLNRLAEQPISERSVDDVLREVAETFGLRSVTLLERRNDTDLTVAHVGPVPVEPPSVRVVAGERHELVGEGPELFAEDRRLLSSLAAAAVHALDARRLSEEASRANELAEVDRLRSALLAAVGHDLRTPIASIKAAVTTLRQHDVQVDEADREELLATIEHSGDRLADLIANLLDLSRLQAGALSIDLGHVALDEVVARSLLGGHYDGVVNRVGDDLPMVLADAGLLERVIANIVDNAHRHGNADVELVAHCIDGRVALSVADHGPGVVDADWDRMFVPFQRLDDRTPHSGIGVGLAIARGFTEARGGQLLPSHTPGGGLTMTLTLPVAPGAQ